MRLLFWTIKKRLLKCKKDVINRWIDKYPTICYKLLKINIKMLNMFHFIKTHINTLFSLKTLSQKQSAAMDSLIALAILIISAQLAIPLSPVPITFQSTTALALGMFYGWRVASVSIAAYLVLGAMGMPVFSNLSFGLPVLLGPKGGYLFGLLVGAYVCAGAYEVKKEKTLLHVTASVVIGTLMIFMCGASYLSLFVGTEKAIYLGMMPFFYTELAKMVALITLERAQYHFSKN